LPQIHHSHIFSFVAFAVLRQNIAIADGGVNAVSEPQMPPDRNLLRSPFRGAFATFSPLASTAVTLAAPDCAQASANAPDARNNRLTAETGDQQWLPEVGLRVLILSHRLLLTGSLAEEFPRLLRAIVF
jgi:hypothetical protein